MAQGLSKYGSGAEHIFNSKYSVKLGIIMSIEVIGSCVVCIDRKVLDASNIMCRRKLLIQHSCKEMLFTKQTVFKRQPIDIKQSCCWSHKQTSLVIIHKFKRLVM